MIVVDDGYVSYSFTTHCWRSFATMAASAIHHQLACGSLWFCSPLDIFIYIIQKSTNKACTSVECWLCTIYPVTWPKLPSKCKCSYPHSEGFESPHLRTNSWKQHVWRTLLHHGFQENPKGWIPNKQGIIDGESFGLTNSLFLGGWTTPMIGRLACLNVCQQHPLRFCGSSVSNLKQPLMIIHLSQWYRYNQHSIAQIVDNCQPIQSLIPSILAGFFFQPVLILCGAQATAAPTDESDPRDCRALSRG